MTKSRALALLVAGLLAACGGDNGGSGDTPDSGTDTGAGEDTSTEEDASTEEDTGNDDDSGSEEDTGTEEDTGAEEDTGGTEDVLEDAVEDVSEDVSVDASEDVEEDADADADVVEDTGPPVPVDCSEDSSLCADPYQCIDGLCWLPMTDLQFAEAEFQITEPEEVTGLFDFLKALALDVKFVTIETAEGVESPAVEAEYGASDVFSEVSDPITVIWQSDEREPPITFRPLRPEGEEPWDATGWISDIFPFVLDAYVEIEIGGAGFDGDIGFDAEEVQIMLHWAEDFSGAQSVITGLLTREEAESRFIATEADFEPLRVLFCTDREFTPDDGRYHLSDVLDCNAAPLDGDLDGDGVNDSYRVRIEAVFAPVFITTAP